MTGAATEIDTLVIATHEDGTAVREALEGANLTDAMVCVDTISLLSLIYARLQTEETMDEMTGEIETGATLATVRKGTIGENILLETILLLVMTENGTNIEIGRESLDLEMTGDNWTEIIHLVGVDQRTSCVY